MYTGKMVEVTGGKWRGSCLMGGSKVIVIVHCVWCWGVVGGRAVQFMVAVLYVFLSGVYLSLLDPATCTLGL
jgi:hypothetical protein